MKLRVVRLPALAAVALAIVGGCDSGPGMMMGEQAVSRNFDSNGERIYFTGRSRSGPAITFGGGNMHLRMMGGGCATCHGDDREGGIRMMPRFWLVAPALTRDALFEDRGATGGQPILSLHAEPGGGVLCHRRHRGRIDGSNGSPAGGRAARRTSLL
jgi:mono/diheme cytochrome c family protein